MGSTVPLRDSRSVKSAKAVQPVTRMVARAPRGMLCANRSADGSRFEARAFVRERCLELSENGEAPPLNTLDVARMRASRYRDPVDRDHFLDGLRKAGLG